MVTAIQPVARFGSMRIVGDHVTEFTKKSADDDSSVNDGLYVLSPRVDAHRDGDDTCGNARRCSDSRPKAS
jgi:glucose-1-phosphate cytidylyltransferase